MIPAVLIDVDTTLADVNEWLPLILPDHPLNPNPGKKDFAAFHQGTAHAPLVHSTIDLIYEFDRDYYFEFGVMPHRIVTTAREASWRQLTEEWLFYTAALNFDMMLMRPIGDRRHDWLVKRDMVTFLREQGFDPVHAWDDSPLVLGMYAEEGIPATEIPRREVAA